MLKLLQQLRHLSSDRLANPPQLKMVQNKDSKTTFPYLSHLETHVCLKKNKRVPSTFTATTVHYDGNHRVPDPIRRQHAGHTNIRNGKRATPPLHHHVSKLQFSRSSLLLPGSIAPSVRPEERRGGGLPSVQ